MLATEVIEKKNNRDELSPQEISFFVNGALDGSIEDTLTSRWLMAIKQKGMTQEETLSLTKAMIQSGKPLDTSGIPATKIGKHSTGGVGDKCSLLMAPVLASMGTIVPMIAGRGLGHIGGTLDKLASIPKINTSLTHEQAIENLRQCGMFIMEQPDTIAPAERKLHSLRDMTATVDSIPLMAAGIMSRKLSEGLDGLILDVKTGAGSLTPTDDQASEFARTMVDIGNAMGVQTVAIITDMQQPLGRTVGNALEVKECISALRGKAAEDLLKVTLTLVAWGVYMSDAIGENAKIAAMSDFGFRNYMHEALEYMEKGDAFNRFCLFIDAQEGDPDIGFNQSTLPTAKHVMPITARENGTIQNLDARIVGEAATILGAGRNSINEDIDPASGIIINKKIRDTVQADDIIAILHTNDESKIKEAEEAYRTGLQISKVDKAPRPLIRETIL